MTRTNLYSSPFYTIAVQSSNLWSLKLHETIIVLLIFLSFQSFYIAFCSTFFMCDIIVNLYGRASVNNQITLVQTRPAKLATRDGRVHFKMQIFQHTPRQFNENFKRELLSVYCCLFRKDLVTIVILCSMWVLLEIF